MNKKIAIVTGVSSGIGLAFSKILKKNNYFVVGISRSPTKIKIGDWVSTDLTERESLDVRILEIQEKYPSIDLLVNNAGMGHYEGWENMQEEDLRKVFELNFFALVHLTQKLLPNLKRTKGSIINISSVAGRMSIPYLGSYCASKFALHAYTESLRYEVESDGIHVLNVQPGRISTGFSKRAIGSLVHPKTPGAANVNEMAQEIYKALKKKKKTIVFPRWYRFLIQLYNIFTFPKKIAVEKWRKIQS